MSRPPPPSPTARTPLHGRGPEAVAPSQLCDCAVVTLSSPAGDVVVLRVAGEVDATSLPVLDAALDAVLDQRPDHLVVDLSALRFCGARGLTAIAHAARAAARDGTGYGISGASPLFARLWPLFWPDRESPRLHPTTATAVLAAVRVQADD